MSYVKDHGNTVERRKQILKLLSDEEQVYVNDLSTRFNVTEVTIRNDLDRLEKQNLLIRVRGGAIVSRNVLWMDKQISEKHRLNLHKKVKIGKLASTLIAEQDTIILDSGTTTCELASNLGDFQELTVITNALNIANELIQFHNINLNMLGGRVRRKSLTLTGTIAEQSLKSFYVDKFFLGVDGIDSKVGLYTPNVEEAHLNQLMLDVAQQVILVTDSSKFTRKSFAFICGMDRINVIVTDDEIPDKDRKRISDSGIELLIAE
jgi:DeoR family transcriptional regulator of aga operon